MGLANRRPGPSAAPYCSHGGADKRACGTIYFRHSPIHTTFAVLPSYVGLFIQVDHVHRKSVTNLGEQYIQHIFKTSHVLNLCNWFEDEIVINTGIEEDRGDKQIDSLITFHPSLSAVASSDPYKK